MTRRGGESWFAVAHGISDKTFRFTSSDRVRVYPIAIKVHLKVARLLYNSSQLSFESLESEVSKGQPPRDRAVAVDPHA